MYSAMNTELRRVPAIAAALLVVAASLSMAADDDAGAERAERAAESEQSIEEKSQALLAEWKERFDEEDFNYVVAGPWVIAGNGTARQIRQYRDRTILRAQQALKATFFDTEPDEPVLILLFETEGPYRRLAKEWFGDGDVPYYGFFRRTDHVMLMNVGTGTGTLVHELTHALIEPDFPDVPDWFNEGLASLYEQCSLDGDSIRGLENWRLPALQDAIRDGELRPLRELIEDEKFYDAELVGINYAQARYLMFYLQEKGLLADYYAAFRDGHEDDATGLKTLEKLIEPQGLEEFENQWRKWVLGLEFQ